MKSKPSQEQGKTSRWGLRGSLIGSVVAGLTASACCAGPFVLLTLGVSGSWIANLSKLEAVRPLFIGIAVVLLAISFRRIYLTTPVCAVDAPCATAQGNRFQKVVFWLVALGILAAIAFPWYATWLLDD
ncbi:MAG: mercuric transporter MerT family protein [Pseudomonadota bacterium]